MKSILLLLAVLLYGWVALAQEQKEFIWKYQKTTLFQGKLYDTFQNQEGDQVVKGRTRKSPPKNEEPTAENLPSRQSIFEWGIGIGFHHSSSKSLVLTNPEDPNDLAMFYDGSPIKEYRNGFAFDVNFAVHPPAKLLKRTTIGLLGTVGGASVPRDKSAENVWDYSNHTFVAKGEHNAAPDMGLNAYVTEDFWYIPAKNSVGIFAAGVYYGYKDNAYTAGVNPVWDTFKPDRGIIIRYRQVFNDYEKSYTNLYVQGLVSEDRTFRITAGWIMMWGRPNAPKTKVEK
jgi:hypothetical protein